MIASVLHFLHLLRWSPLVASLVSICLTVCAFGQQPLGQGEGFVLRRYEFVQKIAKFKI